MPYMHKSTFDIYIEDAGDYFFVDDLMALPIQVLNRKGYITEYCCAGHPFEGCMSYIMFNEGVTSLPPLPDGFNKEVSISDKLVIRKYYKYDGVDVYGIMPVIVETMRQLYEWTLSLSEYKEYYKLHVERLRDK
jgi:hypothetical protein